MARRPWALLVPLTALGAGLLFATSASTAQGTDLRADRRLQLTELIARERAALERRADAAVELRAQVDAASAAFAERD
ncbi:MAG: FIG215594: Membrane spanning protein, partial [uncultured Actinomycetospora sp.]